MGRVPPGQCECVENWGTKRHKPFNRPFGERGTGLQEKKDSSWDGPQQDGPD